MLQFVLTVLPFVFFLSRLYFYKRSPSFACTL